MKQLLILIILSLFFIIGNCQISKDIIDNKIEEVIIRQLFSKLKVKKSLGIPISYDEQINVSNYFDSKTLCNDCYIENSDINSALDFAEIEFRKILKNSFSSSFLEGSDVYFRAKHKKNLMYELVFNVDAQLMTLSYPKKNIEEKIHYENGQLKSFNLREEDRKISYDYDKSEEGRYIKTVYDSKDQTYYLIEGYMQNDRSAKVIHYKKSKSHKIKNIDKIIEYDFYSDGKLKVKKGCDKKGNIRDSIKYFYQNEKLISIVKYGTYFQNSISFKYIDGLIQEKIINDNESRIKISYLYNENDKIRELNIYINGEGNRHKFSFNYISDKYVESIKHNKVDVETKEVVRDIKFLFSYTENNMLKSLRKIDQSGKIKKETLYEMGLL